MSCRVPGARSVDAYWRNLRDGVEAIRPCTDDELRAAGVDPAELSNPRYVKAAGVLDGVGDFDAGFFGFSPKDAAVMDPQARHFMECAVEALEDAACLVFLENEIEDFAAQHADYPREKFVDIIRKTWKKMSPRGQELAQTIALPPAIAPLVTEAIAGM